MASLSETTAEDEKSTGSIGSSTAEVSMDATIAPTPGMAPLPGIAEAKTIMSNGHGNTGESTKKISVEHANNKDGDRKKHSKKKKQEKTPSSKKRSSSTEPPDYLDEETLQRLKDSLLHSQDLSKTKDILDEDAIGIRMTQIDRIVSDRVSQHAVHHTDLFYVDSEDELYGDGDDEDDDDEDAEEARKRRRDSRNMIQRWLYQQEEDYFLAQDFFKQIVAGAQQQQEQTILASVKDNNEVSSSLTTTAAVTDIAISQTPVKPAVTTATDMNSGDPTAKATARTSIMNADTATPTMDDATITETGITTDSATSKNALHKRTVLWVRKAVGMRRNGKNDIPIPPPEATVHSFYQHRHHHHHHHHHRQHERHQDRNGKPIEKQDNLDIVDNNAKDQKKESPSHPTTIINTQTTSACSPQRTPFVPFGGRRLTRGMARHTRIKRREERVSKENQGLDALFHAVEEWEKTHGPLVAPPPPSPTMRTRSAAAALDNTTGAEEKTNDDQNKNSSSKTTENRRKRKQPTTKPSVSAAAALTTGKTTKKRKTSTSPRTVSVLRQHTSLLALVPVTAPSTKNTSSTSKSSSAKTVKVVGIMVDDNHVEAQHGKNDTVAPRDEKTAKTASSPLRIKIQTTTRSNSPPSKSTSKAASMAEQPPKKRKRVGKATNEINIKEEEKTTPPIQTNEQSEYSKKGTETSSRNNKNPQKRKGGKLVEKGEEVESVQGSELKNRTPPNGASAVGMPDSAFVDGAAEKYSNSTLSPVPSNVLLHEISTAVASDASSPLPPEATTTFGTRSSGVSSADEGIPMSLSLLDWMRRQHYVPTGLNENQASHNTPGRATEATTIPTSSSLPTDRVDEQIESDKKNTNPQLLTSKPKNTSTNIASVEMDGLPSWESVNPIPHLPRQPCTLEPPRRRHTNHQYADWCSQLLNSLTGSGRTMARHEFFYSDIDREWFNHSDFHEDIARLGVPATAKLSQSEWSLIRRRCARRPPRGRFTKSFLKKELHRLDEHRDQVRHIQQTLSKQRKCSAEGANTAAGAGVPKNDTGGGTAETPPKYDVPAPVTVGGTVTAYHKRGRILHRGIALAHDVQRKGYLVQFERKELGCEFCPDTDVATHGVPDILAPALNHTVDGSAGSGIHGIQRCSRPDPGQLAYGTSYGPLADYFKDQNNSETEKFKREQSVRTPVPPSVSSMPNEHAHHGIANSQQEDASKQEVNTDPNVANRVAEKESLIQLIGLVEMALNRRKMLLQAMERCHDMFEEYSKCSSSGSEPNINSVGMKRFREHYSWLHANLNLTNESLGPAMAHLQAMYGKAYAGTPKSLRQEEEISQKLQKEQNIRQNAGLTGSSQSSGIYHPWVQSLQDGGISASQAIALDALSKSNNVDTTMLPIAAQIQQRFLQSRLQSASQLLLAADVCASLRPPGNGTDTTAQSALVGDAIKTVLNSQLLENLSPQFHNFPQQQYNNMLKDLQTNSYAAFRELEEAMFLLRSELIIRGN